MNAAILLVKIGPRGPVLIGLEEIVQRQVKGGDG